MKLVWTVLAVVLLLVTGNGQEGNHDVVELFLSQDQPLPQYESIRYMEAVNDKDETKGTMEVGVNFQDNVFSYNIERESGSWSTKKMFRKILEGEKEFLERSDREKIAFTKDNYTFGMAEEVETNLWQVPIAPRREKGLLVESCLHLNSAGDLLFSKGKLASNPSFWVHDVFVEMSYEKILGVRLPINLKTSAKIRLVGKHTLVVKYKYLTVNGRSVEETP